MCNYNAMSREAQFVKFIGRMKLEAPLVAHLRADEHARPDEALPRGMDRAIDLGSEPERAALLRATALQERADAKRGGRPPCQVVDAVIAGPPPWEAADAWPVERVQDWARDSAAWLRSLLPKDTPFDAITLHCDERSPHVGALWPCALPDGRGVNGLSWKRTRQHMVERATGKTIRDPSAQMTALQDHYHEHVGARYDIGRGQRGAGIEYAPLDRRKGLEERAADTAARLDEERAATAQKERELVEAEQRRQREQATAQEAIRQQETASRKARTERDRERDRADRERDRADAAEHLAAQKEEELVATTRRRLRDEAKAQTATRQQEAQTHKARAERNAETRRADAAEQDRDREHQRADAAESRAGELGRRLEATDIQRQRERNGAARAEQQARRRQVGRPSPAPRRSPAPEPTRTPDRDRGYSR